MAKESEDEAERRAHIARVLDDPEKAMMLFTGFMLAGMAGGMGAKKSAAGADEAISELRKRFT